MASSKRWSRLRLGALAVLVLLFGALAYFVSRAAALNEDAIRASVVARLAAWSGGAVEVGGPFALHYFPDFALTMGTLKIADTPRLPQVESIAAQEIRVELGLRSLVLPQAILHRITLTNLDLALRQQPKVIAPDGIRFDARPLIETLRAMPVPEIIIVNGEIRRRGENGGEIFSDVNAFAGISPGGEMRASGRMAWRKEKLDFSLGALLPGDDPAASAPLTLTLGGELVKAEVDGKLALADGLSATGTMALQIPDLRRFTRWVGLHTPDGPGLRSFEASGGFRMAQQRLSFDEGNFVLDENRALGALALDFGAARPLVSGTLAFSSFDLAPYLAAPASATQAGAAGAPPAEQEMAHSSLLRQLDLDLRLSTSTLQTPKVTLGQAAVSATLKAGRLMADFAILDLCNGSGSGRIGFDASLPETAVKVSGNFNRISAQECLQLAFGRAPLTGNLDIFLDATSKGRTLPDLLDRLDGRADIDAGPGSIALDMAALANPDAGAPLEGWPALMSGSTAFSNMHAGLVFKKGLVSAESLKMRTAQYIYSGRGSIDPRGRTIDISVAARKPSPEGTGGEPRPPGKEMTVRIGGTWSKPVVTRSGEDSRGGAAPGADGAAPAPVR